MGLSLLLPVILPLGLWLLCSLAASQEICNSSGTLPAPWLFLNRLSARQGDTAVLSCLVPCGSPVTRIVFCKDGKELSVQPKEGNNRIYDLPYTVSRESAGAFSCRYLHKDDNNQESNSLPSDPRHLQVVADGDGFGKEAPPQGFQGQGSIVGLALTAGLALVLLGCFLVKAVVLRCRAHRDPGTDQSSPATDDQIQYAEVTRACADLQPRQDGHEAVTYAAIGKGSSRAQGARPAP